MPINKQQVDAYEKLRPQLERIHGEMAVLSKSKPDGPINKFKLGHINQLLSEANQLLTGPHVPLKDFAQFDADAMPTNSDVVFVLAQYIEGLEGWRSANVKKIGYDWYWSTSGKGPSIGADRPTRFERDHG